MADGEKKGGGMHWGALAAGAAVGVVVGGGSLLLVLEATDHVRTGPEHDKVKALLAKPDGATDTVTLTKTGGKVVAK